MSAPCLDEAKEATEEQDTVTVSEQDVANKSSEATSQSSCSKRERDHETNDKGSAQVKKKKKHSPDPEPHKIAKCDAEQNVSMNYITRIFLEFSIRQRFSHFDLLATA